eukprot:CAMPEP_0175860168 /NCGR_PEP_ID=MMETSP0107_2-20121207/30669_1 /TAXON_ID=195067 ORGANISM="Goniomonas pacifica, Strain CCMP1869" /NCGR_SAMPLE_ID=MMETSP0107_2 /ASSEMBLY_ACC=CAM_ASM_000203 /LENGTH=52 /DNA_ID=CAMNT_0017176885 /DNA_START=607 /DNA_END=761 /DNA_ORIENTATION=-
MPHPYASVNGDNGELGDGESNRIIGVFMEGWEEVLIEQSHGVHRATRDDNTT